MLRIVLRCLMTVTLSLALVSSADARKRRWYSDDHPYAARAALNVGFFTFIPRVAVAVGSERFGSSGCLSAVCTTGTKVYGAARR